MGGGTQTTKEYQKTDPWAPQQPYLLDAFNKAQNISEDRSKRFYNGDFIAGYNENDMAGLNDVANWARTKGQGIVNGQAQGGQDLFSMGRTSMGEVDQGLKDFAGKDWTQNHIDNANRYASTNPYVDSMIDAATQDARRTFSEDTLRGINQNAAATGNGLSTRAGIAAGVAQRGLADTVANVSGNLRGNIYSEGLKMSQGDQQSLLASLMGRGEMASGNMALGNTMLNDALAGEAGLFGLQAGVADLNRENSQLGLDNKIAKWDHRDTRKQSVLQDYYSIIGDKLWGSEGTSISKTKTQASPMSTVGSIIGALGSLAKLCDVRLKTNIKRIGTYPTGVGKYSFEYLHNPGVEEIGPMAQEVELSMPDAVIEVDGYKAVYMDMVEGS